MRITYKKVGEGVCSNMKKLKILIAVLIFGISIISCGETKDSINKSKNGDNKKNMQTNKFDFKKRTVKLNDGNEMPILGLGTWTLSDKEAENAVYIAIKKGYRLIDTAIYYGNEKGVGLGIKKAIKEGIVKREDIFITSKIVPGNFDDIDNAINESVKRLDLGYIDLMLIHQPGSNDENVYKALERGVKSGKLKSIGISNYYTPEEVDRIVKISEIKPAIIQNENHIYYQNTELKKYIEKYGIVIESWYPFGGRGNTKESFENKTIKKIAQKYKKTTPQIILRWQLQAEYIVIPGSKNPDHINENFEIFDFELTKEEIEEISKL